MFSSMLSSPVRILHTANSLSLGGTEKVMQLFVSHMDKNRFSPAVYSPIDGERATQLRKAGVPTYIGGDLLRILDTFKPHIVHIHRAGWTEPELLKTIKLARVPAVVETNVFGRHDSSPQASIIDQTLFVSEFCLHRFATNENVPMSERYSFLYNPVDTDYFAKVARADRDFSLPVAGRISRADPGKWSRLALEFLPHVVSDFPDFRYHVLGGIPEAYEYVEKYGLTKNVIFHDQVQTDSEIAHFLDGVSLLAHANDTGESFGLVIAEAMACGLPVVTHPSEGLKDNAQLELVDDGRTGIVATTAEEYANALKFLFNNPDKARQMGENGRIKASRLFRAQTVTAKLETIYNELLSTKGINI